MLQKIRCSEWSLQKTAPELQSEAIARFSYVGDQNNKE